MSKDKAFMDALLEVGKQSSKIGYESGWNDCLDDMMKQLKETGDPKKITFQYYGKLDKG
jgi:hypothetical protein